ncbi:serpin family protein [Amycolatopsis suaedae]|uniref:Serpin family protein n=1 Tax=Amycolatopsis suaedae TaxID=2510978 RepID=A0A4Q7J0L9_9PSEU|nr:serpin family protein [Amycolatopsis suaedae]RZQ60337.1 serpin family protein [Amycolatopsis suaedae]
MVHLRFALDLHHKLAGKGNFCFSPYSVASALTLVARAARGGTAAELETLLGDLDGHQELLHAAAKLPSEDAVLTVANTLWAWDELPLAEPFLRELESWPAGAVRSAPFVTDPERARQVINADVAETTRDLIPELLDSGAVDADTVASVVNALYLRTSWATPFPDGDTAPGEFTTPSGVRSVPMMRISERLGYAEHAGWTVVSVPAAGDVEAVVLLPGGDLTEREPDLDAALVGDLLAARTDTQISLTMPKLRLDERADLVDALGTLGVRTVFGPGADLGNLSPDPRLVVSDVQHQAVLRLDENGLEGAAATAAMIRMVAFIPDEAEVRVDRPFLLLVRHAPTGALYFLARVSVPSWESAE